MADQEQVERLKHSVNEWNQWREQQSGTLRLHLMEFYPSEMGLDEIEWTIQPPDPSHLPWADPTSIYPKSWVDLSGADLRGADLYGANLYSSNLSHADLSGANLHRADLHRAILISANLSEAELRYANLDMAILQRANLHRANLISANLNGTDLSESDLSMANLSAANLSRANLEKANWTNTIIALTQFDGLDLRGAIGLETVQPLAPSTIGLDTIYYSHGQISETFLRRVGVPETFITNMHALVNSLFPIKFYSCFISYASADEKLAHRLYEDLQASGVRCWFAPHDLKPGDYLRERIDQAIHMQDKLLLLLSESSVKSGWVRMEVETALAREIRQQREILFPIRIDDAIFQSTANWATSLVNQRHIGDFTEWSNPKHYQQVLARLLQDLKA